MQSIFCYTVAQYMLKLSEICYTQAYTGYMQYIFLYTVHAKTVQDLLYTSIYRVFAVYLSLYDSILHAKTV